MIGRLYDDKGEVIKCDYCDRDAGIMIGNSKKSLHYCSKHWAPFNRDEPEAEFVFHGNKLNWRN